MQLFAYDDKREIISAGSASRGVVYHCLECQGAVRLRGGVSRRRHFYHTTDPKSCRQSGKSLIHLQVQLFIRKKLPEGDCSLEHPFPEISRIADVVWFSQKIVFEVQCSPISGHEVLARNRDYKKAGYKVIWIFHDNRYNSRYLTEAENVLVGKPLYYTNIDERGSGEIYERFRCVKPKRKSLLSLLMFPYRLLMQLMLEHYAR